MKTKAILSGVGLLLFLVMTGTAYGQATVGQGVFHFGGAFTKAMVDNASMGFVGLDVSAGKMITNSLCLGVASGYDVVSYNKSGEFYERLAIIPIQVKVTQFINIGSMLQLYISAGGGAYRALPHLTGNEIGNIGEATTQPGFSLCVGLDYWFLIATGVGFAFEYHMFTTPDDGDMFKYFAARVDYCLIKF